MSDHPTAELRCDACGATLPAEPLENLCPACLLAAVLDADAETAPLRPADSPPDAAPNRIRYLGDYELLDEIGRGAMGVVYRARQTSLGRPVAVKLLLNGIWSSPEAIARFRAEARSAAGLRHPGIVAIHEVGEHDGQPYFSMDLIDGDDLATRLRDGPLAMATAAELVRRLAETVHFAHLQGVVHRDLKPSNVLLGPELEPHVTDFGLAKNVALENGLTLTGAVLGTPGFIPPEQAQGQASTPADPRGDVYSLGAILYAALVGRPPFEAATPLATLMETVHSRPLPPRSLRPAVPRDLQAIAMRCLEKDPGDRYPTALELAEDLGRFLDGRPIRGTTRAGGARRWARRHRRTVAVGALAGLAAALALAWLSGRQHQSFLGELDHRQLQSRELQARQADELLGQARDQLREGRRWRALELLAEAGRRDPTPEIRGQAIEAAFSPGLRRIASYPAPALARLSFSDDGDRLAILGRDFQTERFSLGVQSTATGEVLERVETAIDEQPKALPGPGLGLLVERPGQEPELKLWSPRAGELLTTPPFGARSANGLLARDAWSLSPGRRRLAFGPAREQPRSSRPFRLRDLRGHSDQDLPLHGTLVGFLDEERLLFLDRSVLFERHLDERTTTTPGPTDPLLAISPDLGFAAFRSSPATVEAWDLRRQRRLATLATSTSAREILRLSRQGGLLAQGGDGDALRVWDLRNPQRGFQAMSSAGDRQLALDEADFDRHQTLLAVPGAGRDEGRVWIWGLATGQEIAELDGHRQPAWSPSGGRLATLTFEPLDGTGASAVIWEVVTPVPTWRLETELGSLAFTEAGQRFAAYGNLWGDRCSEERATGGWTTYGLPPPADARRHVVSLQLAGGDRAIDFRSLRPRTRPLELPAYPRVAQSADGTETRIFPYRWAFEPNGDVLLLASAVWPAPDSKPAAEPPAFVLERWQLGTGKRVATWDHHDQVGAITTSPEGRLTAIGGHRRAGVSLWNTATGELIERLSHDTLITALAFSHDGRKLASVGLSDRIEISTLDGVRISSWRVAPGNRALAFDATGELLASGGAGPTVSLWEIATGHELARWSAHQDGLAALAFRPGTDQLVTGGCDGRLKAWDLGRVREELAPLGLGW